MGKVLDDEVVARAFREAGEAVRSGDPDTLAGRFNPRPIQRERSIAPQEDAPAPLAGVAEPGRTWGGPDREATA